MLRYIDADKAVAYVEEQYRLFKDDESKQAVVEGCVEALKFTPTADVAPRSDVAREIFADLEAKAPWFCENQTAYEHFIEELAKLKKKYTEGE